MVRVGGSGVGRGRSGDGNFKLFFLPGYVVCCMSPGGLVGLWIRQGLGIVVYCILRYFLIFFGGMEV